MFFVCVACCRCVCLFSSFVWSMCCYVVLFVLCFVCLFVWCCFRTLLFSVSCFARPRFARSRLGATPYMLLRAVVVWSCLYVCFFLFLFLCCAFDLFVLFVCVWGSCFSFLYLCWFCVVSFVRVIVVVLGVWFVCPYVCVHVVAFVCMCFSVCCLVVVVSCLIVAVVLFVVVVCLKRGRGLVFVLCLCLRC